MDRIALFVSERDALRNELQHLKMCQLRYFTLSVSATGILLSIGAKFDVAAWPALFYYSPLLIILPCWWIFFDKATSITRGAGYLRFLENLINAPDERGQLFHHIGWENALARSRKHQKKEHSRAHSSTPRKSKLQIYWIALSQALLFRSSHLYWTINWYTFFGLAITCWTLGSEIIAPSFSLNLAIPTKAIFPGFLIAISTLYNLYLLGDLNAGRRSYDANYLAWRNLLFKDG